MENREKEGKNYRDEQKQIIKDQKADLLLQQHQKLQNENSFLKTNTVKDIDQPEDNQTDKNIKNLTKYVSKIG